MVAGIFTIGSGFVICGIVSALSGAIPGVTAGLLLYGTANFAWWGAHQYGDIPMAAFVAGGVGTVLVGLREQSDRRSMVLMLGGFILALAGWTKTDGVVAAGLGLVVLAVNECIRDGRVAAAAATKYVAIGAALPALAWIVQHTALVPEIAPVFTSGQETVFVKLTDASRWAQVLAWFSDHAPGRDIWLLFIVIAVAAMQRVSVRDLYRSPALWCAGAMFGIDALVFVLTPLDLGFHLLTAADRLMLQAWPLFLVGVFAAVPLPRSSVEPVPALSAGRAPSGTVKRNR